MKSGRSVLRPCKSPSTPACATRKSRRRWRPIDQSVANYRQTVLTAFQQVEDQLAAIRILARQQKVADEAVKAAQEEVDILLNQYRAGTVAFTAVVVAAGDLADQ